ncbi:MAG TPA: hypothetical protein VIQ97_06750, partial [Prevotella sp.]
MERTKAFIVFVVLMLLGIATTTLVSCSSDDEVNEPLTKQSIVGTWQEIGLTAQMKHGADAPKELQGKVEMNLEVVFSHDHSVSAFIDGRKI